jgi:hypothetical protein
MYDKSDAYLPWCLASIYLALSISKPRSQNRGHPGSFLLKCFSFTAGMATFENAKLRKIPLRDLYVGKAEAIEALIQACKTEGFFYLDLCGDETARMVANVEKLELLGQDIFNCAEEEKTRYDFRKIGRLRTTGYLPFVSLLMMMMLTLSL